MTTSTSRIAYSDCFELMDKAMDDPRGVRINFPDLGDARNLRLRLHTARKIERQENALTYEEGEPLYGRSAYDILYVPIIKHNKGWWVYLKKRVIENFQIEKLSEVEDGIHELVEGNGGETQGEDEGPKLSIAEVQEAIKAPVVEFVIARRR